MVVKLDHAKDLRDYLSKMDSEMYCDNATLAAVASVNENEFCNIHETDDAQFKEQTQRVINLMNEFDTVKQKVLLLSRKTGKSVPTQKNNFTSGPGCVFKDLEKSNAIYRDGTIT